ncbi:MAG: hypothetical protein ACFFBP_02945 [Promethearchaeota archaeon]
MYCPNCGTSDLGSDVIYCPMCGSQISTPQVNDQATQSRSPQISTTQPSTTQPGSTIPSYQSKPSAIGPYSKKGLIFSLISLGLLVAGLIVSSGVLFLSFLSNLGMSGFPLFTPSSMRYTGLIPTLILYGLGLTFSIIAKVNASKGKSETENTVQKVGNVFSILSIIFNCIALGLSAIIGPLIIYGIVNLNLFSPYFW